jgi:hypothetical protein
MSSKSNVSLGARLLQAFFTPFVAAFMLFYEPAKWLSRRAYSEGGFFKGLFVGSLGAVLSVYTGFQTAGLLGLSFGFSAAVNFTGGFTAFLLAMFIIWPAAYLYFFKPLWEYTEKFGRWVEKFFRHRVGPVFVRASELAANVPLAGRVWDGVRGIVPEGALMPRRYGVRTVQLIVGLGSLAFASMVTVDAYDLMTAHVPDLFGVISADSLTLLLAGTVFFFVAAPLLALLDYGKEGWAVASFTGIITHFSIKYCPVFMALPVVNKVALAAAFMVVGFIWVVPAFIVAIQSGFAVAVLKKWKKLLEAVYDDEPNKAYRKFFHHVMNIVLSVVVGALAAYFSVRLGLPVLLVGTVGVAMFGATYAYAFKDSIDKTYGNVMLGLLASIASFAVGWFGLPVYFTALAGGWLAAWSLMVTFATFLVVYPLLYLVFRLLTSWASAPLGDLLERLHNWVRETFKAVREWVLKMQRVAFADTSDYAKMFGHLFNIVVAAAALWQAWPLALTYLSFGFWASACVVAFVGVNLFMLFGQLFSRYGAVSFSIGLSSLTLIGTAVWAYKLSESLAIAISVSLTTSSVAGSLVAPAIFLGLRPVANKLLTPWLYPLLDKTFDFLWDLYVAFWEKFAVVLRILRRAFGKLALVFWRIYAVVHSIVAPIFVFLAGLIAPLFVLIAGTWVAVWGSLSAVFGRK